MTVDQDVAVTRVGKEGWRRWLRLLTPAQRASRRPVPLAPWPSLASFGPRPEGGFVVGGAVRDRLLGREVQDVDWVVPDPRTAAKDLADRLGGSPFELDGARGHWRVVHPSGTVDLAPLRGSLEEDVRARDFTVNAMVVGPEGPCDPLGGKADLEAGRLEACSDHALRDDPLRGLRGLRLAATHALAWTDRSRSQAATVAAALRRGDLPSPAKERIRDELTRILFSPRPGDALQAAHQLGWLALILPDLADGEGVTQGGLHHHDVLTHQLEALQRLATGFPHASLALRLATLLHDVGKPSTRTRGPLGRVQFHGHAEVGGEMTAQALRALRYDRSTVQRAAELVRWHMLPLPREPRAIRRFVHRRRALLPDLLSLMLADREAARGRLATEASRRAYREAMGGILAALDAAPQRPPLLRGEEVMELLGLEPGPRVGAALRFVEEARAVGDVTTPSEAREALRAFAEGQGWGERERT